MEYATASVSSPGLEEYLGLSDAEVPGAEQAITTLVDGLEYLNANQRGYLVVTFTTNDAVADWRFVDTVKSSTWNLDTGRAKSLRTLPGAANRVLVPTLS